jgi:Mrp family chromosome partitioning ATPase
LGVPLVDALVAVDVQRDRPTALAGALQVLTVGRPPSDPGGFLLSGAVAETLEALEKRGDVLLIVTPPLLAAGDAMTIATNADALILVAGVGRVRRESLVETRRVLERCPTFTLGVIATGCKATERGAYGQRFSSAVMRTRRGSVGEASRELVARITASVGSIASGRARRPTKSRRVRNAERRGPAAHAGPRDV